MDVKKFKERLDSGKGFEDFHFPYRMQVNQAWPEKGDLEKRWYYQGRWYNP
jgi:hypothetical protein